MRSIQLRSVVLIALAAGVGLVLDLAVMSTAPSTPAVVDAAAAPPPATDPVVAEPTTADTVDLDVVASTEPLVVLDTAAGAVPLPTDPIPVTTGPDSTVATGGIAADSAPAAATAPVAPVTPSRWPAPPATTPATSAGPRPSTPTAAPTTTTTTAPPRTVVTTTSTTMPITTAATTTSTTAPTTTAPTTTAPATTVSYPSYNVSTVGQVVLTYTDGSRIQLYGVYAGTGWVYQVESNGPRTVKLKFFNTQTEREAEWTATIESGRIKIEN